MPELPEVETVVRDLRPLLVGRRLAHVETGPHQLREPWDPAWRPRLTGRVVAAARRRGKWILLDLDDAACLVVHLGMTGQLTVTAAGQPRASHTHLVAPLDDGRDELRFRDIRRFGSARLFAAAAAVDEFLRDRLGPEPFDLRAEELAAALAGTDRCLKAVLLDQTVVAGVGNIYADESLFRAGLHPARRARTVTPAEAARLRDAVAAVLTRAVEYRGSTIRDYVGGSGLRGGFQDEFAVYGRTGEPCPACGGPIECLRLAGRSSHFCPVCQPATTRRRGRVAAG
jgi:formamidopyrimidine-DNA glycosylase